ncbi:DUF3592 domain-containing protein [Streptomyces sp. TLI_146]|uniref:DUF3592 domain-containing protein n=1 Tax=Streptomyces sp. TLI_146 TaxID=1938858 RepID=UPI0035A62FC5
MEAREHADQEGGGQRVRGPGDLDARLAAEVDTAGEHRPYVLHVAGDAVPVRYLPERPDRAMAAEATPGLGVVSCLFGGVMVILTCVPPPTRLTVAGSPQPTRTTA